MSRFNLDGMDGEAELKLRIRDVIWLAGIAARNRQQCVGRLLTEGHERAIISP